MWYQNSFRRHLCDMHIDDWNEAFLSRFDPKEYLRLLKTARVDAAMIYLQSHVGLCHYPTKEGRMHRAFEGRENAVADLIADCRKNGIAAVCFVSISRRGDHGSPARLYFLPFR